MISAKLLELILADDLSFEPGCRVVLVVNSLRSPMMELLIVLRALKPLLRTKASRLCEETLVGPVPHARRWQAFPLASQAGC
jgi:dihydroxyacetone kinase